MTGASTPARRRSSTRWSPSTSRSAQPVGSQHVVDAPGVSVSSATVRSDMATLERDGYLAQPHTSAGRIPTDKGYRFFVDHLGGPGPLDPGGRQQVRQFFDHAHGEIEQMLERTSGLLADLTDCTAMVVGPSHESAADPVGAAGRPRPPPGPGRRGPGRRGRAEADDRAARGCRRRACCPRPVAGWPPTPSGRRLAQVGDRPRRPPAIPTVDAVVGSGRRRPARPRRSDGSDQLFVGGSSRMAAAFDAVDTVRSVLTILEQQLVVVSLLRDILDTGLTVAIGAEHGVEPLASCAIVVMPISVDGLEAGTIGLLGPDPDELPAGPGRGPGGGRPPG